MQIFNYRTGTIADLEKLKVLGMNSYGQYKDLLSDVNWKKLEAFLNDEKTYPHLLSISKCFVCEHDDEIIGMAFFVPNGNPTDIFQADWSYLRMVGVNTEYAGNGIGRALIKMCVDYARESLEKTIGLHTADFMNAARHIYEDFGFKMVEELEPRLGKRYWLYLLEL